MIGSEIPTHFLGRPLGRFSPVASAFCKWRRNTTYFIPQHYLTDSVTRNSFPVTLATIISLGWHQGPSCSIGGIVFDTVIMLVFLTFPSQSGQGMPHLHPAPRVLLVLIHPMSRGTEEHAHAHPAAHQSLGCPSPGQPWGMQTVEGCAGQFGNLRTPNNTKSSLPQAVRNLLQHPPSSSQYFKRETRMGTF